MVPLMPFSSLTRSQNFVTEEWNTYFGDGKVAQAAGVEGGWKGILYANLAIINPTAAFNFFNQQNFDPSWLDGGASRTWYLAFAAGMFQATMTSCSTTDISHRSRRSTLSGGREGEEVWPIRAIDSRPAIGNYLVAGTRLALGELSKRGQGEIISQGTSCGAR